MSSGEARQNGMMRRLARNLTWRVQVNPALNRLCRSLKGWLPPPLCAPSELGGVVLFHNGRCGSTLLGDMLGQHPRILWDAEIYQPMVSRLGVLEGFETQRRSGFDSVAFLRRRLPLSGRSNFYGCEVKLFHLRLLGPAPDTFLQQLESLGFRHFIVLKRTNHLKTIVSSVVAHEHSNWHLPPGCPAPLLPIALDPARVTVNHETRRLVDHLEEFEIGFRQLEELLRDRNALWLSYEDDVESEPNTAYQRALDFLGLPEQAAAIRYGRTNPFSLRDLVLNHEEIAAVLRETEFEWMLSG